MDVRCTLPSGCFGTLMIKKILVTGGAGFIGSAVVRQIINETDMSVVNVDKSKKGDRFIFQPIPETNKSVLIIRQLEDLAQMTDIHKVSDILGKGGCEEYEKNNTSHFIDFPNL